MRALIGDKTHTGRTTTRVRELPSPPSTPLTTPRPHPSLHGLAPLSPTATNLTPRVSSLLAAAFPVDAWVSRARVPQLWTATSLRPSAHRGGGSGCALEAHPRALLPVQVALHAFVRGAHLVDLDWSGWVRGSRCPHGIPATAYVRPPSSAHIVPRPRCVPPYATLPTRCLPVLRPSPPRRVPSRPALTAFDRWALMPAECLVQRCVMFVRAVSIHEC